MKHKLVQILQLALFFSLAYLPYSLLAQVFTINKVYSKASKCVTICGKVNLTNALNFGAPGWESQYKKVFNIQLGAFITAAYTNGQTGNAAQATVFSSNTILIDNNTFDEFGGVISYTANLIVPQSILQIQPQYSLQPTVNIFPLMAADGSTISNAPAINYQSVQMPISFSCSNTTKPCISTCKTLCSGIKYKLLDTSFTVKKQPLQNITDTSATLVLNIRQAANFTNRPFRIGVYWGTDPDMDIAERAFDYGHPMNAYFDTRFNPNNAAVNYSISVNLNHLTPGARCYVSVVFFDCLVAASAVMKRSCFYNIFRSMNFSDSVFCAILKSDTLSFVPPLNKISNNIIITPSHYVCAPPNQDGWYLLDNMVFEKWNHAALLQATQPTGGTKQYTYTLQSKTSPSNKWVNRPDIIIPTARSIFYDTLKAKPDSIITVSYRRIVNSGPLSDTSNVTTLYYMPLQFPSLLNIEPLETPDKSIKLAANVSLPFNGYSLVWKDSLTFAGIINNLRDTISAISRRMGIVIENENKINLETYLRIDSLEISKSYFTPMTGTYPFLQLPNKNSYGDTLSKRDSLLRLEISVHARANYLYGIIKPRPLFTNDSLLLKRTDSLLIARADNLIKRNKLLLVNLRTNAYLLDAAELSRIESLLKLPEKDLTALLGRVTQMGSPYGHCIINNENIGDKLYWPELRLEGGCPMVRGKTIYVSPPDGDGNIYPAVKINEQYWMISNLRTTTFNDGTKLSTFTDAKTGLKAAYTWYNNNAANGFKHGALYNSTVILNDVMTNTKNVCPLDWKPAGYFDWNLLAQSMGNPPNITLSNSFQFSDGFSFNASPSNIGWWSIRYSLGPFDSASKKDPKNMNVLKVIDPNGQANFVKPSQFHAIRCVK